MTQLSRLATLGLAKETVANTYTAPTVGIPFDKADFEDKIDPLRDESIRGNDTVLQGVYQGSVNAEWDIDVMAYPDLTGHFLRAVIGPDTVTAGISTTLSASTTAGATSISVPVSIPAGSLIKIDTAANIEYALTGTPTGSGPYTIPITSPAGGLTLPHSSSVAVVSATKHTFKQDPTQAIPSYSLTVNDTTQTLGYAGTKFTDLQVKIDPKASVSLSLKALSLQGVPQSNATETYSAFTPHLGWTWTQTQNSVATTRGLSLDLTIKRAGEAIGSSDGTQGPREIFVGALECDGSYKAIFENQTDIGVF
ncbi:phage tail tube protein, partial [Streptacidiphilus griseoplanus]|uniref:phage tail tube protein n=1 Tax=Peterkaempfera griseoplana TaxID=66896 RepID=UPI0006E1EE1E